MGHPVLVLIVSSSCSLLAAAASIYKWRNSSLAKLRLLFECGCWSSAAFINDFMARNNNTHLLFAVVYGSMKLFFPKTCFQLWHDTFRQRNQRFNTNALHRAVTNHPWAGVVLFRIEQSSVRRNQRQRKSGSFSVFSWRASCCWWSIALEYMYFWWWRDISIDLTTVDRAGTCLFQDVRL